MGPANGTCILCGGTAESWFIGDGRDTHFNCGVCGEFSVSDIFREDHLNGLDQRSRAALSAATRQSAQPLRLDSKNWEAYRDAHLNVPVATKVEKLREEIRRGSASPGQFVPFEPARWYPLVDAVDDVECRFIADNLLEQKLAEERTKVQEGTSQIRLTAQGWEKSEKLRAASQTTAFVALWFDEALSEPFNLGFKLAIQDDCGFTKAIRIDREHFPERIDDRIEGEIRQCRFLVADFTGHRGGVYFEAGFALGLGKPVIWTCRKDHFNNAHFDTNHYPHVLWETPEDLREKLTARIRALIPGAKLSG